MKFLFDFVACCGHTPRSSVAEQPLRVEEKRSLVGPSFRQRAVGRCRKRGRHVAPAAEWQPSLRSISEENTLPEAKKRTAETQRKLKRTASESKVRARTRSVDHGRTQVQTAMPTFSPTPFMF